MPPWCAGSPMPDDCFDGTATAERLAAEALMVEVDGFEGPLDLLLTLARSQKVDLRRISVLHLAEQYLAFVEEVKRLRIELAADYLVMAAWLAYLKSRLLLPSGPKDEGPSGEEMAERLAFQLQRLEAMRQAAAQLMARDQLGRDIFARGDPQPVARDARVEPCADLMDLLRAYSRIRTKADFRPLHLTREAVCTMEQALERMRALLGACAEWRELSAWLPEEWRGAPKRRRSAVAASFAAALELVKAGQIDLRQDGIFQPILLRARVREDEQ
jgi:segregation and condensation protein A